MKKPIALLLSALLLLVLHTAGAAVTENSSSIDPEALRASFEPRIARAARRNNVPGVSIVLVDAGRIVWKQDYGLADVDSRTALDASHRWPLGEASKLITMLATLASTQRGELDLDDSLDQLWPEHPLSRGSDAATGITPRRLLSHHSGLAPNRLEGLYRDPGRVRDDEELDEHIYLAQPSGLVYAYSNLGYVLLGQLLEQRASLSFTQLAQQRVLDPLNMRNSGWDPGPWPVRGHHERRTEALLTARDQAALGLWASSDDVAQLLLALSDSALLAEHLQLSAGLAAKPITQQNAQVTLDFSTRIGLAWQLFDSARPAVGRVARIGSGGPRYRGEIRLIPGHQLALAVFANSSDGGELVGELSRDILDQAMLAKAGIAPMEDAERRSREPLPEHVALPAGAEADTLAMRYVSPLGLIDLEPRGGEFSADFLGRTVGVRSRDDGWYELRYRLLGVIPVNFGFLNRVLLRPVRVDGERMLLAWFGGNIYPVASHFEAPPPDDEQRRLFGRYEVANPDQLFEQLDIRRIRAEDCGGVLCFSYELPFFLSLRARVPMVSDGNGHLRVPGIGPLLGERLQIVERDGQPAVRYSGYELRRIGD